MPDFQKKNLHLWVDVVTSFKGSTLERDAVAVFYLNGAQFGTRTKQCKKELLDLRVEISISFIHCPISWVSGKKYFVEVKKFKGKIQKAWDKIVTTFKGGTAILCQYGQVVKHLETFSLTFGLHLHTVASRFEYIMSTILIDAFTDDQIEKLLSLVIMENTIEYPLQLTSSSSILGFGCRMMLRKASRKLIMKLISLFLVWLTSPKLIVFRKRSSLVSLSDEPSNDYPRTVVAGCISFGNFNGTKESEMLAFDWDESGKLFCKVKEIQMCIVPKPWDEIVTLVRGGTINAFKSDWQISKLEDVFDTLCCKQVAAINVLGTRLI